MKERFVDVATVVIAMVVVGLRERMVLRVVLARATESRDGHEAGDRC
jgi:hypothetical protein